jgi:DNA-binding HxlR family transcriptional regulator
VRWDDIGEVRCSVARALSVVGDRWTLLILRDLFLGSHRFEQFEASLRASPHLISTRLRKLVDHGILERLAYREKPVRHEYRLTEKGRDLYPVIAGLLGWGDRWMADEDGPPVTLVHEKCGHRTNPELHCSECGERLEAREVRPRLHIDAPGIPARRTP